LVDHASTILSDDDLKKVMAHDGELAVSSVDLQLCKTLESAAPFGRKNPEPVFLFKGLKPTGVKEVGNGHLKAVVDSGRYVEMIAFGAADRAPLFAEPIDVLATPELNEFRGMSTLQLRVKDLAASAAEPK